MTPELALPVVAAWFVRRDTTKVVTVASMTVAEVPQSFVDVVRSFDSHERGILFQWAAGAPFAISTDLRMRLSASLGIGVPPAPFVAMDYTLDWLYAAVTCFANPRAWVDPQPLHESAIRGSQEDVDLLLAWDQATPHVVVVEAKGFTGWSNKQMESKALRFGAIFPEEVRAFVDAHFVLAGPKPSAGLSTKGWPQWMANEGRLHFLEIPDPGPRWSVRRAKPQPIVIDGESHTEWTEWRPVQRKWT